jgi:hypothetical protein
VIGFIKKLFRSDPVDEPAALELEYKGFKVLVKPRKVDGGYGVGGIISKEIDGQWLEQPFIRADSMASKDVCVEVTANKAKMTIDQMGEALFSKSGHR